MRGRSREPPLDPHGRSHMPALPGDVVGMKEMLHLHCWVLEPDPCPNPALSHEFGCGKEKRPKASCPPHNPSCRLSSQRTVFPAGQSPATASGSEWQLCPARRPLMSPSKSHNTKSRSTSPGNQAQTTSTKHSLAMQCDCSQQQWPCPMPPAPKCKDHSNPICCRLGQAFLQRARRVLQKPAFGSRACSETSQRSGLSVEGPQGL